MGIKRTLFLLIIAIMVLYLPVSVAVRARLDGPESDALAGGKMQRASAGT